MTELEKAEFIVGELLFAEKEAKTKFLDAPTGSIEEAVAMQLWWAIEDRLEILYESIYDVTP